MKQFLFSLFLFATPFSATLNGQILDAHFTGQGYNGATFYFQKPLSQSFTAGRSGSLMKVAVMMDQFANCTESEVAVIRLKILEGTCNGPEIANQFLILPIVFNTQQMQEFILDHPPSLVAGRVYTLQLSLPSTQLCSFNDDDEPKYVNVVWRGERNTPANPGYTAGSGYDKDCKVQPFDYYFATYFSPTLKIDATKTKPQVTLYPNPVKDFLQISALSEQTSYQIHSLTGAIVKKGIVSQGDKINVRTLPKGIYILHIESAKLKFVKE